MPRVQIRRGPTRGHHVNVWGYLLELLVESSFVVLTPEGGMTDDGAQRFGKRSVWPVGTIREAFRHLRKGGLVVVVKQDDGALTASVDMTALLTILKCDCEAERKATNDAESAPTIRYFRSRRLCARLPWLDRILEAAHDK